MTPSSLPFPHERISVPRVIRLSLTIVAPVFPEGGLRARALVVNL